MVILSRNNHIINIVYRVTIFKVYTVYAFSHVRVTGYDIIGCNYIVTMVVKQIKKIN